MSLAFDPRHPSALAVYCSDGRFTRAVEALLRRLGHDRLDTMTLPGGPALLNHGPADLSEVFIFSRATRFLIDAHKIKHAVLLAHQNCGFYQARFGRLNEERIRKLYKKYGFAGLFVSRFLPGVRAIVPPFAGAMKLPAFGVILSIASASLVWFGVITFLAFRAGDNWDLLQQYLVQSGKVAGAVAIGIVLLAIAIWLWKRRKSKDE